MNAHERPEGAGPSETAVAWTPCNVVEAQIAEAALREAGIPCAVEDFAKDPYDGLWHLQKGFGRIRVSQADLERARHVIRDALSLRFEDGAVEE